MNGASARDLKRLIEQIESLTEQRDAAAADISEKIKEAKQSGFDGKIIRKVLAIRKKGQVAFQDEMALIETYLGALSGTPLGNWAEGKERKLAAVS
jgi:uncharacterized protein (UPF0335 family)